MNKKNMNLETLSDAKTWYTNSGLVDLEWFPSFNSDDLIEFAYRKSDGIKTEIELVTEFLCENNQDPKNYF